MPEQYIALIDELVKLRKEKGWSQKDLADTCGMAQSGIARIENKRVAPSAVTVCKIAEALGAEIKIFEKKPKPLPNRGGLSENQYTIY